MSSEAPQSAQPDAAADSANGGCHVLYAEDNQINVMLVTQIMQMRPRCKLSVAKSGAEAIEAVRRLMPTLILLDMHLGDMTGFEVAEALDKEPATAAIPRVALSADAMPDIVGEAQARGFKDYLTKPLDVAALLACVDEHINAVSLSHRI